MVDTVTIVGCWVASESIITRRLYSFTQQLYSRRIDRGLGRRNDEY